MATRSYGAWKDSSGWYKRRNWIDYTVNNQTTYYELTLNAGVEVNAYGDGVTMTFKNHTMEVAGTGQTTKTAPQQADLVVNKGQTATRTLFSSNWTWRWNKGTSSQTITITTDPGWAQSSTHTFTVSTLPGYTVSYNANGGSNPPGNQTKYYNVNLTLSSGGSISRTGYTLSKWNTKADGTGTNYAKGATYTGNTALTLYAIWTPNTYTVTYNSNAPSGRTASGSTANSSHTYDVAKNLTANGYSVPDYVFTGWATSATGAVAYINGQSVKNLAASGTTTLYAIWRYAYSKPLIDPPNARRYNGPELDDTGTSARVSAFVTPAQVENSSFVKTDIETRVYAQARRNGETSWPAITTETTGYQIVDGTTGKTNIEFLLVPPSGDTEFGTDVQFDVRIVAIAWVSDVNKAEQVKTTYISKANFILDINPDGRGLGIFTAVNDNADGLYIGKEMHLELDILSGTDPLYAAIIALGWQNDVME